MNSWGILGNPTAEQIGAYKEMPYGQFKVMLGELKKKSKGKTLKQHKVRVRKIESSYKNAYVTVEAFTADLAVQKVTSMDKSEFEWHESIKDSDKYTYQVVQI
jgi:hypothetical protein